MKHIIGIDNGNGTTEAYTNINGKPYKSFNSNLITYGDQINQLAANLSGESRRLDLSEGLIELNGNSQYLICPYLGTNYAVGLTGAYISGAKHISPVGKMRYRNEIYMRVMLMAAVTGLVNKHIPLDDENELYLGLGMAPGLYYSDERQAIIDDVEDLYLGHAIELDGKIFTVKDIVFTAEGLGAYYSHVFKDDMTLDTDKSSGNTVIVDAGQGTLDTFIISDFDLYGDVSSEDIYGTTTLFKEVANDINKEKLTSLDATDVELFYYTNYTPKRFTQKDFDEAIGRAKPNYLSRVQGHLTETYHGKGDYYSKMIVTGGIAEIFEGEKLKRQIGLVDTKHIKILPINANAIGFYKAAYVTFSDEDGAGDEKE